MSELISGQKLIEELENLDKYFVEALPLNSETVFIAGEVRELIESQPPADQWIPCSERLPKEDGEYLVWYDCGDDETGCMVANFYEEEGAFGYWHNHYDYDTLGYVDSEFVEMETSIAWMPLPEPYKGE